LKAFFRPSWFQRKWTIQEATVVSNATLFCGDWQADWSRRETVDQAIHKYGLAVNDHTTYDDLKNVNGAPTGARLDPMRWSLPKTIGSVTLGSSRWSFFIVFKQHELHSDPIISLLC
jgi:hypothetical protein